jgi:UDP:flavonoid glycosyltransferase YjiC (YdhE family)
MFGTVMAPQKLPELRQLADQWRPDIVLHAAVDLAAPLLAAERGIPSVTYGLGLMLEPALLGAMAQRVAPLWRASGLDPDEHAGLLRYRYLDPIPTSLQPQLGDAAAVAEPVRPSIPGDPGAALPAWVDTLGNRPVVYVSLGTVPVFNQLSTFTTLLGALAHDDVDLIVTVGPTNDPAALADQPENVHVEQWLPLAPLLPRCDAVLCHGGAGTTLAALSCGLPLLLTPQGADQFVTADACAHAGVARVLRPDEHTATAIGDAIRTILGESTERAAARALRNEIDAMPPPSAAVEHLQELLVNS